MGKLTITNTVVDWDLMLMTEVSRKNRDVGWINARKAIGKMMICLWNVYGIYPLHGKHVFKKENYGN